MIWLTTVRGLIQWRKFNREDAKTRRTAKVSKCSAALCAFAPLRLIMLTIYKVLMQCAHEPTTLSAYAGKQIMNNRIL